MLLIGSTSCEMLPVTLWNCSHPAPTFYIYTHPPARGKPATTWAALLDGMVGEFQPTEWVTVPWLELLGCLVIQLFEWFFEIYESWPHHFSHQLCGRPWGSALGHLKDPLVGCPMQIQGVSGGNGDTSKDCSQHHPGRSPPSQFGWDGKSIAALPTSWLQPHRHYQAPLGSATSVPVTGEEKSKLPLAKAGQAMILSLWTQTMSTNQVSPGNEPGYKNLLVSCENFQAKERPTHSDIVAAAAFTTVPTSGTRSSQAKATAIKTLAIWGLKGRDEGETSLDLWATWVFYQDTEASSFNGASLMLSLAAAFASWYNKDRWCLEGTCAKRAEEWWIHIEIWLYR